MRSAESGCTGARSRAVAALILHLPLLAGAARAADIEVVTLTKAGPDRQVPVGSAFYLTGAVRTGVDRIQPVVIRKGSNAIIGGREERCGDLRKRISGLTPDAASGSLPPGVHGAGKALATSDGSLAGHQVLLPGAWARAKPEDDTYRVLVPADREFFQDGLSYCLLVFEVGKKTDAVLAKALLDYFDAEMDCTAARCPAAAERKAAIEGALQAKQATGEITARDADGLRKGLDAMHDPAFQLVRADHIVNGILNDWALGASGSKEATVFGTTALSPYLDADSAPLGRAVVSLAAQAGALYPVLDARTSTFRHYTTDGKVPVRWVGVMQDGAGIRVARDRNEARAEAHQKLEVGPGDLVLPASTVTVRDLLELPRGRVRLDGTYVSVAALQERLRPILQARAPLEPADTKRFTETSLQLRALSSALERAFRAAERCPGAASTGTSRGQEVPEGASPPPAEKRRPAGTPARAEADLGEWLCTVAVECAGEKVNGWGLRLRRSTPYACATGGGKLASWPGYAAGEDPLAMVAAALDDYVAATQRWGEGRRQLEIGRLVTVGLASEPLDVGFEFTQETWFFSYVTPVVGYAVVPNAARSFWLFYVGAQVHAFPNPVNQPQWTHGSLDWRRAVALELGASTSTGPFGPDGRFAGWSGLPPVYAGLAFHAIPYTSLSAGGVLASQRRTTFALEERRPWLGWYFGLNVQANIPDLFASRTGKVVQGASGK